MKYITGFHAIEERIKASLPEERSGMTVLFANPGPRVKKICASAAERGIPCRAVPLAELDAAAASLPETARDHRGIILQLAADNAARTAALDAFIANHAEASAESRSLVVVLDSVTDPHNIGAVIRSCDQFGVDLLVLPSRHSAKDGEVVARASAGASAWVPIAVVPNLVRAAEQLKAAGYWIYGADASGTAAEDVPFAARTVLIMGSEGRGIGRLLRQHCDAMVSIPTCGRLDSLNVSVAAGILLYETVRQNRKKDD
ncbi:MAG: 23S rRNA (guanosine(2251)-2'-O)-methyltransferase RlmB [Bacteroides sp.]|nr:23S rRNA (guanosine(2251)-2'-O)-methyltransferase RlmB [Prevotella sp.]MCM1408665.1 23S rRNA (guanosine(2251)-2'-O)-methyltransferase RlmB [Treponema brennaborense]MCM1470526.1 23S rRNA (guanosine(2251)-2'-O)-methyltransferase RlmB [Bacteroides sp.]